MTREGRASIRCVTCGGSGELVVENSYGANERVSDYDQPGTVPCPACQRTAEDVAVPLDMLWPGGYAQAMIRGLESDVRPDPGDLLMGWDMARPGAEYTAEFREVVTPERDPPLPLE